MTRRLLTTLSALTGAVLLVVATIATAAPATAAWSGENGRIAYEHAPGAGNSRIWWSAPDGTDPAPVLFLETGFDSGSLLGVNSPEWAPDGQHLAAGLFLNCAFGGGGACSNEVAWVNTATGAVRQLTCDGVVASPSSSSECITNQYGGVPSPDGTAVAFITDRLFNRLTNETLVPGGSILSVPVTRTCGHNTCDSPFSALTNDSAGSYRDLSWSPNASHLLAIRHGASGDDIVAVASDGSGTWTSLTGDLPRTVTYTDPRWSPDGTQVMVSGGGAGLYTFGVSCATSCARTSDPVQFFTGSAYQADYSPDGTRAVLVRPFGDGTTGEEVWTVSLTGINQGLQRVTTWTSEAGARHPSWQPVRPDPLSITSVTPPAGSATPAKIGVTVSATFNQPAANATLSVTKAVKKGATPIAGATSCATNCASITFTPARSLAAATYVAVATGTDNAGATVTRTWQFTITKR
jgi:hypothetical protein